MTTFAAAAELFSPVSLASSPARVCTAARSRPAGRAQLWWLGESIAGRGTANAPLSAIPTPHGQLPPPYKPSAGFGCCPAGRPHQPWSGSRKRPVTC